MKKKVLLGTILPVLATVAVIGSGYSIFYLGDQTATANNNLGGDITQVVGVGTITKASDFSIVFDQTEATRSSLISSNSKVSALGSDTTALGVHFYWANYSSATKVVTYTSPSDPTVDNLTSYDVYDTDNKTGSVHYEFIVEFNLGETICAYVNMESGDTGFLKETSTSTGVYTFKYTSDSTTSTSKEFDLTKVALSYVDTKEPKTVEEYSTLKTAINNAKSGFKVTYTVNVYANIND